MFSLDAVSPQRLYRLIAEKIADRIRAGDFPVGGRLPAERDLADMLQVSRSSVREALIALELGGYIEVRVGSGVFVLSRDPVRPANLPGPPPALAQIAADMAPFEILEARALVEPECAAMVTQQATDHQLARIREALDTMKRGGASSYYDRLFHLAVAAGCGNSALEAVDAHLWDLTDASPLYQRLEVHFVDSRVWDLALAEHDNILQALLDRDPIRARHAMHMHLVAVMARLREDFAGSLADLDGKRRLNQALPYQRRRL